MNPVNLPKGIEVECELPYAVEQTTASDGAVVLTVVVDSGADGCLFVKAYDKDIRLGVTPLRLCAKRTGGGQGDCILDSEIQGEAVRAGGGGGSARRDGAGAGNAVRDGAGDGWAEREGEGDGDARRLGKGAGDAVRDGDGDGDALRTGGGNGDARRFSDGNGDAIRDGAGHGGAFRGEGGGNGDALRLGSGDGDAWCDEYGRGDAMRTGAGNGNAVRCGSGKGRWVNTRYTEAVQRCVRLTEESGVLRMPAGDYFVGDPCYAFAHDEEEAWYEFLSEVKEAKKEDRLPRFRGWLCFAGSTAYGDGGFGVTGGEDNKELGNCSVDSGMIGCLPGALVDSFGAQGYGEMVFVRMENDFDAEVEGGRFSIGGVEIDTAGEAGEEAEESLGAGTEP